MAVMRLPLRPILAGLVPVLMMALLATLVGGCSSDAEPDADGPTVTVTGDEGTTSTSTDTTGSPPDPATEAPSTPPDRLDPVEAVCAPYAAMVSAIKEAASSSTDADEVAAEIGPVLKEFAAQVPGLEPPPTLPDETWQGVVALATHIADLPAEPTDAEIEAVEGKLTEEERQALDDAFIWFQTNCV